jgi:hypothetical protein
MGRKQTATTVSESGLYEMIFQSRKAEAREFMRWLTHDVLPSIRKTGRYGSDAEMLAALPSSRLLAIAAEAAKRAEVAELELESARPKVEAFDMLMDSDGLYSMEEVAKTIGHVGRNTLYQLLRDAGVIEPNSTRPYQRYMEHFALVLGSRPTSRGPVATWTTRVRPSGLPFILSKLERVAA